MPDRRGSRSRRSAAPAAPESPASGRVLEQEIFEQPRVAQRLLSGAGPAVEEAARAVRAQGAAGLVIAARGTSDHAAIYAKYLFEIRNRLPVGLAAPSAFGLYRSPPRVARYCVVGVSQSGASVDICTVLERAREQGARTIALTNRPRSRLGRAADHVLALEAGPELSVPASKTYTATLVLIAMLSQALDPDRDFASSLHRIPAALEVALRQDLPLGPLARALDGPRLAVLGRGFHLATAQEIALKIMETSYSIAEARSLADFLHGPLAIIEPGFPVLLIEAAGPTLRQMRTLEGHLRQLGAQVAVISDRRIASTPGLAVRTGLPEALTPLPFAVVGQRVALQLARDRGIDPDRPRSLQKVTITR